MSQTCLHLLSEANQHRDTCRGCASVPLHVASLAGQVERMFANACSAFAMAVNEDIHFATVRELAVAMHDLEASGARVRIATDPRGRWLAACEHGHDGIVDNTELSRAREALGDERCAEVYAAERERLFEDTWNCTQCGGSGRGFHACQAMQDES